MQIHELNNFNGTPGATNFLAIDNGSDTARISGEALLDPVNSRIDNLTANVLPDSVETILDWADVESASKTLSKNVSGFDYLDLYFKEVTSGTNRIVFAQRYPRTAFPAQVTIPVIYWGGGTDPKYLYFQDLMIAISGTTLTMSQLRIYSWDGKAADGANIETGILVDQIRVDGVKISSNTSAELTDLRTAHNGTVYASARAAREADYNALEGEITSYQGSINELNEEVFEGGEWLPNFANFNSVASNSIRGGGASNGNVTGNLYSITAKLKATSSTTETIYLLEKYTEGLNYYRVYAHFTANIPRCNGEVVTLKNGTDFNYSGIVKPDSVVAMSLANSNLYYYTDGTKGVNLNATTATDGQIFRALDIENNYNISIGFSVRDSRIEQLEEDVNSLLNPSAADVYNSYIPDFSTYNTPAAAVQFRVGGRYSETEGYLHSITAKIRDAGTATVYLLTPDANKLKVFGKFDITVVPGVHEYVNGVDFNYSDKLPQFTYVGFRTDLNIYYGVDPTGLISFAEDVSLDVGGLMTPWPMSYNIAVGITVKNAKAEVEKENADRLLLRKSNRTAIFEGGHNYFPDTSVMSCIASTSSLNGKLNLLHSGTRNVANGDGSFINFETNKFGFYKAIATVNDTLTTIVDQTIGFTLQTNRKYGIQYSKSIQGFTLTITDLVSLQTDSVSAPFTNANVGSGHGDAVHQEPSIINVSKFVYLSHQEATPKALIIGDSWTDGNTMAGNKEHRWCSLYNDAINGEAFLYSMGGAGAFDGLQFIEVLKDLIAPTYVIIEFGVNQGNLNVYKTNMTTLINVVKNTMNAIPVLVKIPPTNGASSSIYTQINQWVEDSGELYIDMCTPLTVNGDGTSRISSLFFADGVHPNVDGHRAIFENMKATVPQLF